MEIARENKPFANTPYIWLFAKVWNGGFRIYWS